MNIIQNKKNNIDHDCCILTDLCDITGKQNNKGVAVNDNN
jgi:hypothetical protein